MNIADFRSLPGQAQEAIRYRAVAAVEAGYPVGVIAEIFHVSRMAMSSWKSKKRKHGEKSLGAKTRGRPKGGRKITPIVTAWTAKAIMEHSPQQMNLPYALWNQNAVAALIAVEFQIIVSRWTVARCFARCGFTLQKPVRKAYEQDPLAVMRWLRHQYPVIAGKAKKHRELLFWGDEVGFRSFDTAGRSYGKRGITPLIGGTAERFGCNAISVINRNGHLFSHVFTQNFSADVFIGFAQRLIRRFKNRIHLIVDPHPVHKGALVRQWLKAHQDKVRIHMLPAKSPELNPVELLNNDVKSNAARRMRPHSKRELVSNIRAYLRKRAHSVKAIIAFFKAPSVSYAFP